MFLVGKTIEGKTDVTSLFVFKVCMLQKNFEYYIDREGLMFV